MRTTLNCIWAALCSLPLYTHASDLTVPSGNTYDNSAATYDNSGSILTIESGALFNNSSGTVQNINLGTVNNSGIIDNINGTIINDANNYNLDQSIFNNLATGIINNISGSIQSNSEEFHNYGVINNINGSLEINGQSKTYNYDSGYISNMDNGVIRINSGELGNFGVIDNEALLEIVGGTLSISGNGILNNLGTVAILSEISIGTLAVVNNSGHIENYGNVLFAVNNNLLNTGSITNYSHIDNVTNSGGGIINNNQVDNFINDSGTFENYGLVLGTRSELRSGNVINHGTIGDIKILGGVLDNYDLVRSGGNTRILQSGQVINHESGTYNGLMAVGTSATFSNHGYLESSPGTYSSGQFQNDGNLINYSTGNIYFYFGDHVYVNNSGTLENHGKTDIYGYDDARIINSGIVRNSGTLTVFSASSRNGGGISNYSGGIIDNGVGGIIETNLVNNAIGARIVNNGLISVTPLWLSPNARITNNGTFEIRDQGVVSSLQYRQDNGQTIVDGKIEADEVLIAGGIVNGIGAIQGNVTVLPGGSIKPGSSPGQLTVLGNVDFGPGGSLEIEVMGTILGSEYDNLNITGDANLGGIFTLALIDGFHPRNGATFDVLYASTISGAFNSLFFPTLDNGLHFELDYLLDPNGIDIVRVSAVPIPAAFWLFGSGLVGLFGYAWRRKKI